MKIDVSDHTAHEVFQTSQLLDEITGTEHNVDETIHTALLIAKMKFLEILGKKRRSEEDKRKKKK